MKMPELNKRILELVQLHAQGNVSKFANLCNMSSSQKLNRIFSIDSVSKKFPVPSTDIILDISKNFSELDLNWLIRGVAVSEEINEVREDMQSYQKSNSNNIEDIIANKVAEKLLPKINKLSDEIEKLDSKIK